MRVVPLSASVRQLTWFGLVNAYLVQDRAGDLTLVDTGVFAKGAAEVRALAEGRLRRVVLTHAHSDHVGGVTALAAAEPALEIAMSERDARLLAGDYTLDPGEPPKKIRGSPPKLSVKPTRFLKDGDVIGTLRVVASPGHTPGHLSLLSDDGVLLAGDAFVTIGRVGVCSAPSLLFPLPRFATWDAATAVSSARRLTALGPAVLAVGHGMAVTNPVAAMARAVDIATTALPTDVVTAEA